MMEERVFYYDTRSGSVVAPDYTAWPSRCICCNSADVGAPTRIDVSTMTYVSWFGVIVALFVPLGMPLGLLMVLFGRARRRFEVCLCAPHKRAYRVKQGIFGGGAALLATVVAWGLATGKATAATSWEMSIVAAFGVLMTGVLAAWLIPLVKVKGFGDGVTRVWIRGNGAFASSLPSA